MPGGGGCKGWHSTRSRACLVRLRVMQTRPNSLNDRAFEGALSCSRACCNAERVPSGAVSVRQAPVFLAAPTSTDERLKAVAKHSCGFVYAISRTGITGTRQELANDARSLVERLRRFTKLPIAVGFGVSTPEQFARLQDILLRTKQIEKKLANPADYVIAAPDFFKNANTFDHDAVLTQAKACDAKM